MGSHALDEDAEDDADHGCPWWLVVALAVLLVLGFASKALWP